MSTDNSKIIEKFLDLYLKSPGYKRVQAVPDQDIDWNTWFRYYGDSWFKPPPFAMLTGEIDSEGYRAWIPVDSPIDAALIGAFERFLEIRLPSLFAEYLCSKCLLTTDLKEAVLPSVDPRRPMDWLEWSYRQTQAIRKETGSDVIAFTSGPLEASTLCFDPNPKGDPDNYKILIFDCDELYFYCKNFYVYFEYIICWLEYAVRRDGDDFVEYLAARNNPDLMTIVEAHSRPLKSLE